MTLHALELASWRRQVSQLYAFVRAEGVGQGTWEVWREERDRLFGTHPQTPLDDPATFAGLPYFDYDPAFAVEGQVTLGPGTRTTEVAEGTFVEVGTVAFELAGRHQTLPLWWLDSYGGGLFLPFRDATSGYETYGGGRYLLDGAKGADLGGWSLPAGGADAGPEAADGMLVLDFNFAYHPSCVHSPRWICPLAPPDARLDVAVTAGERLPG